ncbi:MAG: hypothetical protein WCC10_17935 [Tumebacillaceae bacterium]
MKPTEYKVAICGCGPAGISPLVYLEEQGRLDQLLAEGACLIESSARIGDGTIGKYRITANSLGKVFLEIFKNPNSPMLQYMKQQPSYRKIQGFLETAPPLPVIGEVLADMGRYIAGRVAEFPSSQLHDCSQVQRIQLRADGRFDVTFRQVLPPDQPQMITADHVIYNLGGHQELPPFLEKRFRTGQPVWLSGEFLQGQHDQRLHELLRNDKGPLKLVMVGAAHSAFSALYRLKNQFGLVPGDQMSVNMTHRSPVRLFYSSPEEAERDGYPFDPVEDVCPLSGRVNRYSGMRYDSCALGKEVLAGQYGNVTLTSVAEMSDAEYEAMLDEADIILSCIGYRNRAVEFLDADGSPLEFLDDHNKVFTDENSNPYRTNGEAIHGLYMFGLGAGLRTGGSNGGEASYAGRIDGVWFYQHLVAERLFSKDNLNIGGIPDASERTAHLV